MKKFTLIIISLFSLASCSSDVKNVLGLNRTSPNEYAVLRQPPLSMPPNDYLLPPGEQEQNLSTVNNETAEEILYGKGNSKTSANQSLDSSDRSFIQKTEHINKNQDIKAVLSKEAQESPKSKKKSILNLFKPEKEAEIETPTIQTSPSTEESAPVKLKKKTIFDSFRSSNPGDVKENKLPNTPAEEVVLTEKKN
jgi:hypothetical protein